MRFLYAQILLRKNIFLHISGLKRITFDILFFIFIIKKTMSSECK